MSDIEYEIIDELYFLSSFEALCARLSLTEIVVKNELKDLLHKGWIKCLKNDSEEEIQDFNKFDLDYKKYNYLVSKAGLLAHNSR